MKLLVSVRNCVEARIVASCNVPVVDLKEPSGGSLGQARRETTLAVAAAIDGQAVLSLAMGELVEYQPHCLDYLQGYDFVKIGLSWIPDTSSLRTHWQRWAGDDEIKRKAVVVAYADYRLCQSMKPRLLAQYAVEVGAPYFLIDTWNKSGHRLLDWISINELQEMIQFLSAANVGTVLAGSLDFNSIKRLRALPVSIVAVRGAACVAGNRKGAIDPCRISQLKKLVEQPCTMG